MVLAVTCLGWPAAASSEQAPISPAQAQALGTQAYVYGFPLLEFLRVRRDRDQRPLPRRAGNAPINSFSNATGFATPRDRTVVAPNVDTLYSIAHLDLGKGPIVLTHPRMGKPLLRFELLDPYTNVIGYRARARRGATPAASRSPGKGAGEGERPAGHGSSRRYRRVWVIGRTLATRTEGSARAHALMATTG